MRVLLLVNNRVGWKITQWLKEQGESIVGLVLHPSGERRFGDEIVSSAEVSSECIFDGSKLQHADTLAAIRDLEPEIGLSILFGYILRPSFLDLLPCGVVNLHPAYLPYNRGAYPNVWSIVEGTPAGVTLHYVDAGVDTGDTIAQRRVWVEPVDTGETLYRKLESASVELFMEAWPLIRSGEAPRVVQRADDGTSHRATDVHDIDEIDLDRLYTARELIDIIRARTFPPYPGAYFVHEERKVYLQLDLQYEGQRDEGGQR